MTPSYFTSFGNSNCIFLFLYFYCCNFPFYLVILWNAWVIVIRAVKEFSSLPDDQRILTSTGGEELFDTVYTWQDLKVVNY